MPASGPPWPASTTTSRRAPSRTNRISGQTCRGAGATSPGAHYDPYLFAIGVALWATVGWIALPGVTNGVAGIGLVLLSLLHAQAPDWDRMLLLSHR